VLLDLLVELVALLAVFLGLVDLLTGLSVEVVPAGRPLGNQLVQVVPSVAELAGELDGSPLDLFSRSSSVTSTFWIRLSILPLLLILDSMTATALGSRIPLSGLTPITRVPLSYWAECDTA